MTPELIDERPISRSARPNRSMKIITLALTDARHYSRPTRSGAAQNEDVDGGRWSASAMDDGLIEDCGG